jgi:hypothetical protein
MQVASLLQFVLLALGILNLALLLRLGLRMRRQARSHAALVQRLLLRRRGPARLLRPHDAFPDRSR